MISSGMPGDPSRIVHVSSMAHAGAKITADFDLDSFADDAMEQYGITKLLMNLNCKALSMQLKGTHSEIACLHPGIEGQNCHNVTIANFCHKVMVTISEKTVLHSP